MPSPPATPLPLRSTVSLSVLLVSNAMSITILFPYVTFMVRWLGVPEAKVGVFAGFLGSAQSLGAFSTAYAWGRVSDTIGRRPCFTVGMVGTACAALVFGTSTTYTQALLSNFAMGCLNAVGLLAKAYMADITDSTNRGKGMSILGLTWGMGMALGPAIGGYTSQPCAAGSGAAVLCGPLTRRYPFIVPALVVGATALGCAVHAYANLPETVEAAPGAWKALVPKRFRAAGYATLDDDTKTGPAPDSPSGRKLPAATWQAIACYAALSLSQMCYEQALPVWATSPRDVGGLALPAKTVGCIMLAEALPNLALVFWFPALVGRFGLRRSWSAAAAVAAVVMSTIPLIGHLATGLAGGPPSHAAILAVAAPYVMVRSAAISVAFIGVFTLIANSTPKADQGRVTGISMMFGSGSRMLGPMIGGAVCSWSMHSGTFSADVGPFLPFVLMGTVMAVGGFLATLLPESIESTFEQAAEEALKGGAATDLEVALVDRGAEGGGEYL